MNKQIIKLIIFGTILSLYLESWFCAVNIKHYNKYQPEAGICSLAGICSSQHTRVLIFSTVHGRVAIWSLTNSPELALLPPTSVPASAPKVSVNSMFWARTCYLLARSLEHRRNRVWPALELQGCVEYGPPSLDRRPRRSRHSREWMSAIFRD